MVDNNVNRGGVGSTWMGAWSYLEEGSQVKIWWINIPSTSLVPLSGQREGQYSWRVVG